MKILILVLGLSLSSIAPIANASSGQALRKNIAGVEKVLRAVEKATIFGQVCDDTESKEYALLTSRKGEIYALSTGDAFSSSAGDEGLIAADTAEVVQLSTCTRLKFRF